MDSAQHGQSIEPSADAGTQPNDTDDIDNLKSAILPSFTKKLKKSKKVNATEEILLKKKLKMKEMKNVLDDDPKNK